MDDAEKKENLQDILSTIVEHISAIYVVDRTSETYEEYKADYVFKSILPPTGMARDLYNILFMKRKEDSSSVNEKYMAFADNNMFMKDNYQGKIEMKVDEEFRHWDFRIIKMTEHKYIIIFIENHEAYNSLKTEQIKMDTIQENYLFSMFIDLKNDTCQNSITTEVGVDNQNYMDLKYSQWRYIISNMFLPDDKPVFFAITEPDYIISRLEKEKMFRYEIKMQNMQGEFIWVRLTFNRVKGFSRETPVFVYTVQDIDEDMNRLLQQENIITAVEEKNRELDNINKAKTVFISNMSHEIRTPINAVLGMDEMIIREAQDPVILDYAYNIRSAGKMLLSIINDILDFSKIESGKMDIIPADYSLATMINDINNMISIKAKEKDISFRMRVEPTLPSVLYGDEVRLKQIIINILSNAVKYTEKGGVIMLMDAVSRSDEDIEIKVTVKDSGIGMRQEEMSKLFTAFERLDEGRNRHVEGTGLGMSIVVRLLELMGSKLEVESEYGKGSTFSFIIRQKIINNEAIGEIGKVVRDIQHREENVAAIYKPEAKVLAVDDNNINLKVIKGLLKRTGVQVDLAAGGQECLDMLVKKKYDIIFLDHLMPGMDGIETLNHIRGMGEQYKNIPVIALTANAMSDARERYLNSGFDDYLEKPINSDKLEKTLIKYLNNI